MAASLSAVFVTRALGVQPYLIATTAGRAFSVADYLLYALLGLLCALVGIMIMRLFAFAELRVHAWKRIANWKPLAGGLLLIPLGMMSPQTLSAGHGARSEEHTSELPSLMRISYAVFFLKTK